MSKITAADVKQFFNNNFYPNGKGVEQNAILTFKLKDQEAFTIPCRISADSKIRDVFKNLHTILKTRDFIEIPQVEEKATEEAKTEIKDFGRIEYKNHIYLVEDRGEGLFYIQRADNQKPISLASPIGKAILKKYQKEKD